jgi:MSHA biogenesis protein MshE
VNQRKKIRLGDLLIEHKVISEAQLGMALAEQKKTGRKLGHTLIENGFIDEDGLLQFLSKQLELPFIDLGQYPFNSDTIRLLPEIHARRFRAIALEETPTDLLVGMADPTNILAFDELSRMLKRPLRLAVVRESELLRTIDMIYRRTEEISGFAEELQDELTGGDIVLSELSEGGDVADAPVVKLLHSMFEDALQVRASDIHIEPDESVLRFRQRIDGVLHEQVMDEKRIAAALVLKLKLMAGLNISEKRLPQDGRFSIKAKDRSVDVRISTMPVEHGESVVMRLLDHSGGMLNLDELGMPDTVRKRFGALVSRRQGMVLVTGPTGSGKTTTLYAALELLNKPEHKIITVEDPVEYRLSRINQVQIHSQIGLTFARVLRSALRQDPDVVLVGEMRDEETAEIGARAAMTGHMVLSTLHTNDAISTVTRLVDMGVKSYLLASVLHAILAQRLVRRVCKSCAQPIALNPQTEAWVHAKGGDGLGDYEFVRGAGCPHCNNTGYSGRIGIYQLLELDSEMTDALGQGDRSRFIDAAKRAVGYQSLDEAALVYAGKGITSLDEAMRLCADLGGDDVPDLDWQVSGAAA